MAHLTALGVTMMAGHLAADGSLVLATEAARAAPPATAPRPTDLVLDGLTDLMHAGAATGIPSLTRALHAFASPETDDEECLQWSWLVPGITPEVWDEELWDQVTARAVDVARNRGALILLPITLLYRANLRIHEGQLQLAAALLEEAGVIHGATGQQVADPLLIVAAWRGQEAAASSMISDGIPMDTARGDGRAVAYFEQPQQCSTTASATTRPPSPPLDRRASTTIPDSSARH